MLLYIVVIQVLANFISTDKMIRGIQIGNHVIKVNCGTEAKLIVFQNISKRKLRKEHAISSGTAKIQPRRQLGQLFG